MIFPSLTLETEIQIEDKLRLDASLSFIAGGGAEVITDVLIQPETTDIFMSVYNTDNEKWFLDWAYATEGIKTVTVKVITDLDVVGRTREYTVDCLAVEDDVLFSSDSDLYPFESDLKNYLPKGKNSYLYAHRKAQDKIIAYLDEQRIWKQGGDRYSKQDIAAIALTNSEVKDQFRFWSTFETLLIIFESLQVSTGDIFQEKKLEYEKMRNSSRKRSALRLDSNEDGTLEAIDIRSMIMVRR